MLTCFELSSKRITTEPQGNLRLFMKRSSAFSVSDFFKSLQKMYTSWQQLKRTVPRSIEGHLLRRAKPLFSDVGMHYIAKGNCAWGHGFRSLILACFFPHHFVGVDLPTGIRGQGRRMADGGWQQYIGSSDKEAGSGCRGFIWSVRRFGKV